MWCSATPPMQRWNNGSRSGDETCGEGAGTPCGVGRSPGYEGDVIARWKALSSRPQGLIPGIYRCRCPLTEIAHLFCADMPAPFDWSASNAKASYVPIPPRPCIASEPESPGPAAPHSANESCRAAARGPCRARARNRPVQSEYIARIALARSPHQPILRPVMAMTFQPTGEVPCSTKIATRS